ncbi:MAG: class I SAM-dependent methyltransferase [Bdellovibrionota bacterium]
MVDAKEYWNQFYQKDENTNPEVNYFLKDMLPRLQKGLALDVAMGVGQNSIFLAENGFSVKGFDISNTAVSLAKETAITKKLDIDAQVLDLDFFMMQPMEYDSIIMTRFKPSLMRFFPEMIRGIKQGGTILIESVGIESMERALAYTNPI